jgi:hypothetical protein
VPANPIRRRLALSVAGLVVVGSMLSGCGTGQSQAGSYDDLEAAFLDGCKETAAADAKADESASLPSNFCQCAFDALSDKDTGVDFDELMEINEQMINADSASKLPDSVTKVFADCAS